MKTQDLYNGLTLLLEEQNLPLMKQKSNRNQKKKEKQTSNHLTLLRCSIFIVFLDMEYVIIGL